MLDFIKNNKKTVCFVLGLLISVLQNSGLVPTVVSADTKPAVTDGH